MSRIHRNAIGRVRSPHNSVPRVMRLGFEPLERRDMLDGTPRLVKDIYPGSPASLPTELVAFGDVLLFAAEDDASGLELWRSDGTEAGTYLVKDIQPGPVGSNPFLQWMTDRNNLLFFLADDGVHGRELWRTDGSEAGTILVKDIRSGIATSGPQSPVMLNDTLFFVAADESNGFELWRSSGMEAGTHRVTDVSAGPASSFTGPPRLTVVGDTLFFVAYDGNRVEDLWKFDGSTGGAVMVEESFPLGPFGIEQPTAVGNALFFIAGSDAGRELWKSDGTELGTVLVKDICQGPCDSGPTQLFDVDGRLYFTADDGQTGRELWISDGSVAGTTIVKDIWPGANTFSRVGDLTRLRNLLIFKAHDGVSGEELWRTDGTEAGTVRVKDAIPGPDGSVSNTGSEHWVVINCSVFFANRERSTGQELWVSNGTEEGTHRVRDNWPGLHDGVGGNFAWFVNVNGTLYFVGNDFIHGYELWKSDGTESGTQLVADIWPGVGTSAFPPNLTSVNDKLFFVANDGIAGEELWVLEAPMIGDFDEDADVDHADIDLLSDAIRSGAQDAVFDLTRDGRVDQADHDYMIRHVLGTRPGDTNLDCSVDERDVVATSPSLGAMDGGGWSDGDFDGNGRVDLMDLSSLQSQLDVRMPVPANGSSPSAAPAAEIHARDRSLSRDAHTDGVRITATRMRAGQRMIEPRVAAVDHALTSGVETGFAASLRSTLRASRGRRLDQTN